MKLRLRPRRWQLEALAAWLSRKRGIASVVTGGGKTVFAQLCMQAFCDQFPTGRIIVVVPTASLLDQWHVALTEETDTAAEAIGCYSGEERSPAIRPISIVVINTARHLTRQLSRDGPCMLVVDECHRAGSPKNAESLQGSFVATLGLTATPERQYDDGFTQFIRPTLGDIIFGYDYEAAHADGIITDFDLINIQVDLLSDEAAEYKNLTQRIARVIAANPDNSAYNERLKRLLQRRAAVSAAALMRIPVSARVIDGHRGVRTLVFHEHIDAADKIAALLAERRHSVTTYHSKIGPSIRRDNLLMFRRGIRDVLVCCRALDEGINVPETAVAVIASSTASTRQRIQRLGRVLRPSADKDRSVIYTLYATDAEAKRLKEEEERVAGYATIRWKRGTVAGRG